MIKNNNYSSKPRTKRVSEQLDDGIRPYSDDYDQIIIEEEEKRRESQRISPLDDFDKGFLSRDEEFP